jgi:Spy/CpxP family protein refolding chaperone
MKKLFVSTAAAVALAGSAFTYAAIAAQQPPPPPEMADQGFVLDAKLAGMKAALKLTPEQDKLWPAFEAAVQEADKARVGAMQERRAEREKGERPSPVAMMSEMSDQLAKMSEELKKVADAAKPLYDTFDDSQKRHFGPLLHMIREGGPGARPWGPMGPPHGPEAGPKPL